MPRPGAQKPPIPFTASVPFRTVSNLLDHVVAASRPYFGTLPVGPEWQAFAAAVAEVFPPSVPFDALEQSLRPLLGSLLTYEAVLESAWRLAGNLLRLRRGQPVVPWQLQTQHEWVPVTVLSAEPTEVAGDVRWEVLYRVAAGAPAGKRLLTSWSEPFARRVARETGFERRRRLTGFVYSAPNQLVRFRFYVLLDPERASSTRVGFRHIHVPGTLRTHNRKLLAKRWRKGWECPQGWRRAEVPCHLCVLGYDRCEAACHPKTYEQSQCGTCGRDGWRDPAGSGDKCVGCPGAKKDVANQ